VEVAPGERGDLRDAQACDVQQAQQDLVPPIGLEGQDADDVGLGQDPLGERVLAGWQLHRGAHVERQIAGPLAEGEQRLDRGERASSRAGLAAQGVAEGLDVAEGDGRQGRATNIKNRSLSAR
jgi:hypothetical protein